MASTGFRGFHYDSTKAIHSCFYVKYRDYERPLLLPMVSFPSITLVFNFHYSLILTFHTFFCCSFHLQYKLSSIVTLYTLFCYSFHLQYKLSSIWALPSWILAILTPSKGIYFKISKIFSLMDL